VSVWSFVKKLAETVFNNIVSVVSSITEESILVSEDGVIIVNDPIFTKFAQRLAALIIAAAGILMMFLPLNSAGLAHVGDTFVRSATTMWNGTT